MPSRNPASGGGPRTKNPNKKKGPAHSPSTHPHPGGPAGESPNRYPSNEGEGHHRHISPPVQHLPMDPSQMLPLVATVVSASTEDTPFPATELNSPSANSLRGWQSAKLCSYPQELVFRFDGEVALNQLQILAHESKIPSKVEVLVASLGTNGTPQYPPSLAEAHFKRLGFLSFISNEKTKFRSREKKTVGLSATAYFLKLVLHKCHLNALNNYGQVGIVQVSCSGGVLREVMQHRDPEYQHFASPPNGRGGLPPIHRTPTRIASPPVEQRIDDKGRVRFHEGTPSPGAGGGATPLPPIHQPSAHQQPPPDPYDPYSGRLPQQQPAHDQQYYEPQQPPVGPQGMSYRSQVFLDYDNWHMQKTRSLVARKEAAVMDEEYDVAKICKEQLSRLQTLTNQIYEYESLKVTSIYEERFDDAKAAKVRMDKALEKAYRLIDPDTQLKHDHERHPPKKRPESSSDVGDDDLAPVYPVSSAHNQHAFEEQPVQSKYAQEMAEKAQRDEVTRRKSVPSDVKKKKKKAGRRRQEDADEEEEEEYGEEEEAEEEQPEEEETPSEEEEEHTPEEEEEDEEVEEQPKKKKKKSREKKQQEVHPPKQKPVNAKGRRRRSSVASHGAADEAGGAAPGPSPPAVSRVFDVENFEDWEKAVFFAIQDEMGQQEESESDTPVDPRDAAEHVINEEMKAVLGSFCTACLLSRRWKHREAAIKVLIKLTGHLYAHQPTANVVNCVLKYFDEKGFGMLDPILVCFLTSCEYVETIIDGKFDDCPLSSVQNAVVHLLPRMLLRAGDSTQKSREEALALILGCAKSSIGPERVGIAILADPVDADKRRVPPQNHRIHISRLLILQHVLEEHPHGTHRGLTVDAMMNKLLIPCLNHSNNELRELAITCIGAFDAEAQQEVMKYVHLISNSATKAAVADKLSVAPPPREDEPAPSSKPSKKKSKDGAHKSSAVRERNEASE